MKYIAYNLSVGSENSDLFYNDLDKYASQISQLAITEFSDIAIEYRNFVIDKNIEKPRSVNEYIFEILALGVFWRLYANNAANANKFIAVFLSILISIRSKFRPLKPIIDKIRGVLATKYLLREKPIASNNINILNLISLTLWLRATGEYKQEIKRFKGWIRFFGDKSELLESTINASINFSNNFDNLNNLPDFIYPLNGFLSGQKEKYNNREDIIFTGRKPLEYLLNVYGAVIMNRAWREDFLATNKKALLVPACMKGKRGKACKARKVDLDFACANCSKDCKIAQLNELGKELGFDTFIIPHSSDFSKWLKKWSGSGVGIIATTCVLNLITGGYEAKALDIPIQCVFLDYCGCQAHWDSEGFPTNVNVNRIKRLLANEKS